MLLNLALNNAISDCSRAGAGAAAAAAAEATGAGVAAATKHQQRQEEGQQQHVEGTTGADAVDAIKMFIAPMCPYNYFASPPRQ